HNPGDPMSPAPNNTAQPTNVLDAMAGVLDHLPVVADYQFPAKLSASVGAVPAQVITGTGVNVTVNVSNGASVLYAIGADTLNYSVTTSGSVTGSANGSDQALGGSNNHTLTLTTSTAGNKTGSINVTSTSQSVAAALDLTSVSNAGSTAALSTDAATFTNLVAGSGANFNAQLNASAVGVFSATHTLGVSDRATITGATAGTNLVLTSTARVFD